MENDDKSFVCKYEEIQQAHVGVVAFSAAVLHLDSGPSAVSYDQRARDPDIVCIFPENALFAVVNLEVFLGCLSRLASQHGAVC